MKEIVMPALNANVEIQKVLKDNDYYDGPLDGKIGPQTLKGIDQWFKSSEIDAQGWNKNRKIVGAEQLLYKKQKIEVGKVDGLIGPQTQHAREVYNANLVLNYRDRLSQIPVQAIPVKTSNQEQSTNWPRQAQCQSFYGNVGTNQVDCNVPFTMVLAWDTKYKLTKYKCHKLVKEPMERIWNRTLEHYGYDRIVDLRLHYFGGCLNVRKMRGGSSWSMHAWGIAVDIDPDRNALKMSKKEATLSKPAYDKFWQFVYDEGAISLGKERDFDWMHFQFARL
jgi:peptidoglycan hydrolase-like protein with peptidoglycan-binding domain